MDKKEKIIFSAGYIAAVIAIVCIILLFSAGYMIGNKEAPKEKTIEYYPAPFDIIVTKEDSGDILINGELVNDV